MQVDDRVSLKTFHFRKSTQGYYSEPIRFGASDAVSLESVIYTCESLYSNASAALQAIAFSRNPEHELNPPDEIAKFFTDESLYARCNFSWAFAGARAGTGDLEILTKQLMLHGIVVPSRQVAVHFDISSSSYGLVAEVYYREVKLSRAEANLLNITWGKYRR